MNNILNISQEQIILLEEAGFFLDFLDDKNNIYFKDKDGNSCQGAFMVSLAVDDVLEEILEEFETYFVVDSEDENEDNILNKNQNLSDEEILKKFNYLLLCESPFEIENSEGQIATGRFAKSVIYYLRNL